MFLIQLGAPLTPPPPPPADHIRHKSASISQDSNRGLLGGESHGYWIVHIGVYYRPRIILVRIITEIVVSFKLNLFWSPEITEQHIKFEPEVIDFFESSKIKKI